MIVTRVSLVPSLSRLCIKGRRYVRGVSCFYLFAYLSLYLILASGSRWRRQLDKDTLFVAHHNFPIEHILPLYSLLYLIALSGNKGKKEREMQTRIATLDTAPAEYIILAITLSLHPLCSISTAISCHLTSKYSAPAYSRKAVLSTLPVWENSEVQPSHYFFPHRFSSSSPFSLSAFG